MSLSFSKKNSHYDVQVDILLLIYNLKVYLFVYIILWNIIPIFHTCSLFSETSLSYILKEIRRREGEQSVKNFSHWKKSKIY